MRTNRFASTAAAGLLLLGVAACEDDTDPVVDSGDQEMMDDDMSDEEMDDDMSDDDMSDDDMSDDDMEGDDG